jgi:hypothetical protein
MHNIPSVSYLDRAESRGRQGCHDDHGDNDLDGGRGVCHLEYFVVGCAVTVCSITCSRTRRSKKQSASVVALQKRNPRLYNF